MKGKDRGGSFFKKAPSPNPSRKNFDSWGGRATGVRSGQGKNFLSYVQAFSRCSSKSKTRPACPSGFYFCLPESLTRRDSITSKALGCNDVDLTPARAKIHLQHPASSAPVIHGGQPFAHGPPAGALPLTHNRVFLKRTCGKTAECRIRPAARNAAWSDIPCAFPAGIEDIPSRAAPCTGPARLWPK